MKNKSIFTAFFLGIICLASVLLSQYIWINKTIKLQKNEVAIQSKIDSLDLIRFNQKIHYSLSNVLDKIALTTGDSTDRYGAIKQLAPNLFYANYNGNIEPKYLENLLIDEFYKINITRSFQYSLYDCYKDSIYHSSLIKYTIDSLFTESTTRLIYPELDFNKSNHYFTIYFPFIAAQPIKKPEDLDSPWMFLLLVSLLISIYLGYSVYTIMRQRKLADIKTDFINNMTHELKTPIATIGLSSNMLLTSDFSNDPERLKRYASIIYNENKRLEAQVERVLNIAKIDKNQESLKLTLFDTHEFINDIVETIQINIEEIGGTLELSLNAQSFTVYADSLHVKNVIHNLVENAIKYRSDKRNLHLSIATRNDKKYLIIEISDNGVGISKENQKFIFDKFYRVPTGDVHDVKGFGLGLFYVRSIIEKHGGKVTLKSTFGEGTVFSIYLPLKLSNRLEQFVSQ